MTTPINSALPYGAVIFDKDGTLFDFARTWNSWSLTLIEQLAEGQEDRLHKLAAAIRYDLSGQCFFPDSVAIAGTNREIAGALGPHLPRWNQEDLARHLAVTAAEAELAEAVPLGPFLDRLRAAGLLLGVMTNDSFHSAERHLSRAGVLDRFDLVIGADSGHGAKPDPDPLLAFCERCGVVPARCIMVGDSLHDLMAGRAAGMGCVGVLTGMASAQDLGAHADAVLPDIGGLPAYLDNLP